MIPTTRAPFTAPIIRWLHGHLKSYCHFRVLEGGRDREREREGGGSFASKNKSSKHELKESKLCWTQTKCQNDCLSRQKYSNGSRYTR